MSGILINMDMITLVICPIIDKMRRLTYEHEGLIAVFEEWEVLEFDQPDGNVALVYKETCEKHEWNDQDGGQGHSQLLIWEEGRDDQGVGTCWAIDQDQKTH